MAKAKKQYLTVLNVIACISVVFLHANTTFWNFAPEKRWVTANLIESVFYFAVPVFFMVSGATLMNYRARYTTREFFIKRGKKTLIPFVAWSIISVLFTWGVYGADAVTWLPLTALLSDLFNTRYISVYWFFLSLFGIYLSIPVLSAIPEEKRRSVFGYGILAGVLVNVALPFLFGLTKGQLRFNYGFTVPAVSGYVLYLLIGYWIDHYPIRRIWRMALYLLGVVGFVLHFFGTWRYSVQDGAVNHFFKGYLGLPCVMYSVAVFVFFKYFPMDKLPRWVMACFNFLSGQTFGVYLIHYYIIVYISDRVPAVDMKSILFRTVGAIAIYLVSTFAVWVIQKIPVLKNIIP